MNASKLFSILWVFSFFCVSLFSELPTPILHYKTISTEKNLDEVRIFLKFDSPDLKRLNLTGIAYNKYQNSDELKRIEDALKDSLSRINDNEERQTSEFEYTFSIGEGFSINGNTRILQLKFTAEPNEDSNTTGGTINLNLDMERINKDLKRKKDAQHELSSLKKINSNINETNSKLIVENQDLNDRLTKISGTTNATVTWSYVKTHEGIFIKAESPIKIAINVEGEIIDSSKPIATLNRNPIIIPRMDKKPIFAFSLDKELRNYDLKLKPVEVKNKENKENMSRIIKFIPEDVKIESGEMPEPRIEEIKGRKPIIIGNKQLKLPIKVLGASRILFGIIENEKDKSGVKIPFKIIPLSKKYVDYTKFVSLSDLIFDVELKPKQKYSVYVQPLSECQEEEWKNTSKKGFEIVGQNQILSDEIIVTFGTNTINFMAKTDEKVKLYVTPNEISKKSLTTTISKNPEKNPSHDLQIADIFKKRKDKSAIPFNILLKTEDGSNREQKLTISLKIAQIATENLPKKLKDSMKKLVAYYKGNKKTSVKDEKINIKELVKTGIGGLIGLIFPRF